MTGLLTGCQAEEDAMVEEGGGQGQPPPVRQNDFEVTSIAFEPSQNGRPGTMLIRMRRNLAASVEVQRLAVNYVAYADQRPAPTPNPGKLPAFHGDTTPCNGPSAPACTAATFEVRATVSLLCQGSYPRDPAQELRCGQTVTSEDPADLLDVVVNWKDANGNTHWSVQRAYVRP